MMNDFRDNSSPEEAMVDVSDEGSCVDGASYRDDTSKTGDDNFLHEEEQQQRKSLARNETKAISCLRVVVIFFMVCTAASVSLGVYFYATNDEQDEFESSFEIHGNKIKESFRDAIERKVGAIGSMSNAITNYVLHNEVGERFPFLTIPNFEVLGSDVRVQAEALIVHYAPFVTDETRLAWEEYAFMNRHHIDESFVNDVQYRNEEDETFGLGLEEEERKDPQNRKLAGAATEGETTPDPNILPDGSQYHLRLWDVLTKKVTPDGTGPYLPLWQRSPINPGKQVLLNMNFATTKGFAGVIHDLIQDPKATINKAAIPTAFAQKQVKSNLAISQFRYQQGSAYVEDPLSFLAYPIFDSFNSTSRNLGGFLLVNLYWRLFFTDILPKTAKGIICIIENSYNQTLAYRIDGPQVTYLGEGDPHDPAYDDMMISEDINAYVNSRAGPETRAYKTQPLHDTIGIHKLRIYPTQETEDEYTSNKPLMYTLVVSSVFLVTACVFGIFDFIVQRRQRIVMTKAVQSGALVSSLFPEQVQKQLFDHSSKHTPEADNPWKTLSVTVQDHSDPFAASSRSHGGGSDGRQIADLYPETTILFADLAGFTQWSSTRTPCDVFELLETLYKSFDRIAARRKVFKVETIGDCYLAVCGLPEPDPNHAVVMAKFARDCSIKMNDIVRKVSDRLGPDTASLQLRVGLHSGPVTAGVLRGQKSRFQLFGDTVNTASRMESTGQPGRIQVSQATADELIAKGKKAWLKMRQDKVHAKGKGELTTYWVNIQSAASVTSWGETSTATESVSAESLHQKNTLEAAAPSTIEEDGEGEQDETFSNELVDC